MNRLLALINALEPRDSRGRVSLWCAAFSGLMVLALIYRMVTDGCDGGRWLALGVMVLITTGNGVVYYARRAAARPSL